MILPDRTVINICHFPSGGLGRKSVYIRPNPSVRRSRIGVAWNINGICIIWESGIYAINPIATTYERRKNMNAQSIIPPNIDYGKISADKYSPDDTYEAGELRIQYNSLWKAKQAISVPEPWTPDHWEPTTLAAEFSALNSRLSGMPNEVFKSGSAKSNIDYDDLPPGTHYCSMGCTHAPEDFCRVICLYTYNSPESDGMQIAFSVINRSIHLRSCSNGIWSGWSKFTGAVVS